MRWLSTTYFTRFQVLSGGDDETATFLIYFSLILSILPLEEVK